MAIDARYPGASSRISRGKETWRVRLPISRKQMTLPGLPGSEEFELAYHAAMRKKQPTEIMNMPGRALPRTFGKAALMLDECAWWIELTKDTHAKNLTFIERFLETRVEPDAPITWRDIPVEAMKRSHLNALVMARYVNTPQTGRHYFNALKKLFRIAEEQNWIDPEDNPCLTIKLKKPVHIGEKAWADDAMAKFEAHWPLGTQARTAYEIAKWVGNRRGDVCALQWDQRKMLESENEFGDPEYMDCFEFHQGKNAKRTGGKHMILPVSDKLAAALAALNPEPGKTVLQTIHGGQYAPMSLTGRMIKWTKAAGLSAGHTLHGLRKNFAQNLVKSKVNIMAIRDALGHSSLTVTQVYLEGMKKEDNARELMHLVNERETKRDQAKRRANIRIVS